MSLGERIKELRKMNSLSQVDFGKRIGVSGATISTSESGKTTPDEQTIRAICSEFSINRDWLVDGIGEMQVQKPLLPELIHNLRKYPHVLQAMSLMQPDDWIALDALIQRVVEQKNK